MVEKWRRPLILSSTRNLLDSVLSSARPEEGSRRRDEASSDRSPPFLRLKAGILRFVDGGVGGAELSEDSLLVGVSASVLKKLSITTGSLILVKNARTNVGRIVKVIVLDRPVVDPPEKEGTSQVDRPSNSHYATNIFSSFTYPSNDHVTLDEEVTYIAPLLAFNLGLHVSFLEVLLRGGQESLMSLFEIDGNEKSDEEKKVSDVHVELVQWTNLPGYASHLRISFVKIPECGMLGSLKGRSTTEEDDRQLMIDSALNDYFKVDRFLARGDIFSIHVNWNCRSEMCASCSQEADKRFSNNVIYFKVMAMEPLNELILRVNCVSYSETSLILGGSASSAIPPHLFAKRSKDFIPMQVDTVKLLSSVLAPALCPSSLSSKFRVALFLHGSPGCGKRTVVRYVAHCLGLHVVEYSCHDLMSSSERKASTALANTFKAAHGYAPSVLLLRHFDVFRNLSSNEGSPFDQVGITSELASIIRDFTEPFSEEEDSYSGHAANNGLYLVQAERLSKHPVLLIAAADSSEGLQPPIRRCFSHEISMGPLTEEQRANLLFQSLSGVSNIHGENLEELTKDIIGQTSGFMPRDLHALVADASASFIERTGDNENNIAGANLVQDGDRSSIIASEHLEKEDFSKALERSKKRNASALGTPKVPNVKWEDVGGLEEVKKSILDTVQLPLLHKDLFSSGLRKRAGVLLYGPTGT
ncbi:peroxisome biogenesis protein 6 [Iris pallida]|uniref:Peroxisome biogenesis protein 6 n=1 Tax=Iris pallida TaxID=29817 RepID=A0AAX6HSK5_IRIPA|nr:peroxisome biogenesis protein 6 [Iris pallida]